MITKNVTFLLLGAFLILVGLAGFIPGIGALGIVIAILALAAGILILFQTPGISYSVGWILAAVYLVLRGLNGIIDFTFTGLDVVLAVLALGGGILLLIRMPKIASNIGFFLFCVWLLLVGLVSLVTIGDISIVIDLVAIAAGVLLIIGK